MSPDRLNYLAAATGIVGAITGIVAVVMAYVSLRRTSKWKVLDLRLELRKLTVDTNNVLKDLPGAIEMANQSRIALKAAMGTLNDGDMETWKQQVAEDRRLVEELQRGFVADDDYKDLRTDALEAKMIEIHELRRKVEALREKYATALADDDRNRDHIRADVRQRFGQPHP